VGKNQDLSLKSGYQGKGLVEYEHGDVTGISAAAARRTKLESRKDWLKEFVSSFFHVTSCYPSNLR